MRSKVSISLCMVCCSISTLDIDPALAAIDADHESKEQTAPGWLGLGFHYRDKVDDPTYSRPWLYVHFVHPAGPAQAAGFRTGDAIVEINGHSFRFESQLDILDFFAGFRPGERVTLGVLHGKATETVEITVGFMPDDYVKAWKEVYSTLKEREAARRDPNGP